MEAVGLRKELEEFKEMLDDGLLDVEEYKDLKSAAMKRYSRAGEPLGPPQPAFAGARF